MAGGGRTVPTRTVARPSSDGPRGIRSALSATVRASTMALLRGRPSMRFQRFLTALLPTICLLLGGCDEWTHKQRYFTYCDDTGCYLCTPQGCSSQGGVSPGGSCRANPECAAG